MDQTKRTDGGPAFPRLEEFDSDLTDAPNYRVLGTGGMSLRDYFAAKALHRFGLDVLDRIAAPDGPAHDEVGDSAPYAYVVPPEEVARRVAVGAYLIAEAMLKARG